MRFISSLVFFYFGNMIYSDYQNLKKDIWNHETSYKNYQRTYY